MENLSPADIGTLRNLFGQMNTSRRQLRPILADIANSIDKGFFIDADSEEVNNLLKQILEIQEKFASVEQLKRAVNSKNLEQVDKGIVALEQNSKRDELNLTLARIEDLVVDSDDPAIIDAVKKVKLQVERLRNKALKIDSKQFVDESRRFILLAEIIDSDAEFSPNDFIKISKCFEDNPLIAMILTSRLVHFKSEEPPPPEEIIEESTTATAEIVNTLPELPSKRQLNAVLSKCKKFNPNFELVLAREENFVIEKANPKKQLTVKSFNNKIRELFDAVDTAPIFKILVKTRIFFTDDSKEVFVFGKITPKNIALVPRLFDKLFSWGIVDKISWNGRKFYFLNDFGFSMCIRNFTNSAPLPAEKPYFEELTDALQLSLLFLAESHLKNLLKCSFAFNPTLPSARISGNGRVALFFSLIALGEAWIFDIARFKLIMEHELPELKAVFFIAFSKQDIDWLKVFDATKFKKVFFFMYTWDGFLDKDGEPLEIEVIHSILRFATPELKPKQIPAPKPAPVMKSLFQPEKPAKKNNAKAETQPPVTIEIEQDDEDIFKPDKKESETKTEEPVINLEPEISDTAEIEIAPVPLPPVIEEETISENVKFENFDETEKTSDEDLVKADILSAVTILFKTGETARGMLALHALKEYFADNEAGENWADYLTKEIGFILNDPMVKSALNNFDTFTFWTGGTEIPKANIGNTFEYLNLAATIKNFFAPDNPASYQLQKIWKQLNEDKSNTALRSCPAAKNLISLFQNFTDKTHRAFAASIGEIGDNSEDNFKAAVAQIKNIENIADSVLRSDINHRRVRDVVQQLFKNNGLARKYLYVENFSDAEILDYCQRFTNLNLREFLKEKDSVVTEEIFSEEIISDYLDEIWNKPEATLSHRVHEPFKGPNRIRVTKVLKKLFAALTNYVQAKKILENSGKENLAAAPVDKALEIIKDLQKQIQRVDKRGNLGSYIFGDFVENLRKRLNGESVIFTYKTCLLGANYIELENNMPSIESFGVEEFSLQKRFFDFEDDIKDKTLDENLKNAYDTALKNYDCGILQNLKIFLPQLSVSEDEINKKINAIERQIERQIERIYTEFLNDLELARNYSRITDQEKIDGYINSAAAAKNHFLETKNAGLFQRFVNACNDSINAASQPQKNALQKRLADLEANLSSDEIFTHTPILANVRRQIDLMNLTVAEDYLNRLEREGGNLLTELDVTDSDLSTLEEFLASYEILLHAILNANGSVDAAYRQKINTNRLNRKEQDSLDFARGWRELNSGQNPAIESAIILILEHLGYKGGKISAQNMNTNNQKSYTVTFSELPKVRESYAHPFAIFGTEIYKQGLEIIYLSANRTPDNIAQVLGTMTTSRGTIVLLNASMTLPNRRALAKSMKLTPNLKNIIVIDRVLALYLTRFDDAQRGKKMLQAALPFARVQPYIQGGVIAPEMFIGRSEELDQIRDMNGPVFVYGGRQLGKSALLRQVRSIEHNPAQGIFAFFIDLKNLNSEQTLKKIVYELTTAKLLGEVETWQEFSFAMHRLFDGQLYGVKKPNKILLLLDESDTFLSSRDSETAIDILRELLVAFSGRFKFVLAGLHKVIRFEQNSSFGNLNHISVLPFKPSDAMELLIKPMSYLGFKVAEDSLLSAIFSRTNYYPGSIQYYCKMLVDAAGSNYSNKNFDVTKNPPYILDDEYLKNMLGNREFQEEINQKFQITLHLDDDDYYEIIALAVASIYYENNRPVGVDVNEIRDTCLMCGVDKITKLSDAELLSLLDEMVVLNLLRRNDGKFEFNRYAFWHMMGTEQEVNDKLDSYGLHSS